MTADQIAEALPSGGGDSAGGGDSTENYMRKRFREDLFKEDTQPNESGASGSGGGGDDESPNKYSKSGLQISKQQQQQDSVTAGSSGLLRPSNILPATEIGRAHV